jgi:hypothetical protein
MNLDLDNIKYQSFYSNKTNEKRMIQYWSIYKKALENGKIMAEMGRIEDSNAWYLTAKRNWEYIIRVEREMKTLKVLNQALAKKGEESKYYNW